MWENAMKIKQIWRSGLVRRWHSNPDMASTVQTNAHHQWGCAVLAMHLFADDLDLLRSAILHDVAEVDIGDVSGLAKSKDSDLKTAMDVAEDKNAERLGVDYIASDRLKLIDMLDAYLWVKHHKPEILTGDGWPEQIHAMRMLAFLNDADIEYLL